MIAHATGTKLARLTGRTRNEFRDLQAHALRAARWDDFIDRVMRNPVLNANTAVDEAHHRVSAAAFKYYVTEMVCWATGGPQTYTGRSMNESHKHLKITESEWAAFCKDFDDTMAKFNVP